MTTGEILYLAFYWPPIGNPQSYRAWNLARGLAQRGWKVHLFASHTWTYRHRDFRPKVECPKNLFVHRIPSLSLPVPTRVRKWLTPPGEADAEWTWRGPVRDAVEKILVECKRPILFSSSYPYTSHMAALEVKRRNAVPWTSEFRDPWTRPFEGARGTGNERRMEEAVFRTADRIIVVSEEMKRALFGERMTWDEKCVVLPGGFDETEFTNLLPAELPGPPPRLLFSGTVYYSFLPALRTLASVWKETGGSLIFLGSERRPLRKTGILKRKGVFLLPRMSVERARGYEAASDYLLIVVPPKGQFVLTAKFASYLRHRKPIVLLSPRNGTLQRILDGGRYPHLLLPLEEPKAWGRLLERWLSRSQETVPEEFVRSFCWPEIVRRLENVFKGLQEGG
ncbi:MAG: hypothetical protein D6679_06525 [Candidatus Hydrogenedentota bacterium]|nr:MAG: hypothetical protein D6679_06525 [Candidatus Hydrogenedentota bacterium]